MNGRPGSGACCVSRVHGGVGAEVSVVVGGRVQCGGTRQASVPALHAEIETLTTCTNTAMPDIWNGDILLPHGSPIKSTAMKQLALLDLNS